MITLLQNAQCYCPWYSGKKDILIAGSSIAEISDCGCIDISGEDVTVVPCEGLSAFPGIIDGHVHITGGGGEDGFSSRIPEISVRDILMAGITTAVGLLGADGQTRSLKSLLAKAKALESEGVSTFIYSGSYAVPIITFTGDITDDMVLIDKVIGAGEVAISDRRSSYPNLSTMMELASKAYLGGLISGKAGLLHIHVGDGKSGLSLLNQMVRESDIPIEQFLPTHVNRSDVLFRQALEYAKSGGYIDLTAGEEIGISVPDVVEGLIAQGVDLAQVTVSSDANGSTPGGAAGRIQALFDDVIGCITQKDIKPEIIFSLVTENPAKRLKIYPQKGTLSKGSHADIMLLDGNYALQKLYSMGKPVIDAGKVV